MVINSGATDHVIFNVRLVSSLNLSSQNCVSIANGNTTPVISERSLHLTNTLHLDFVLVSSSLNCNLPPVSQITSTLSCVVIFWPKFFVFKDIQTRQMIGYGVKRDKLYYLDLESTTSSWLQQALAVDSYGTQKKKVEIWLWHQRLGHASSIT